MELFQKEVNKLKVEEMCLLSALRDKQLAERSAGRPLQDEKPAAADLTDCKTQAQDNEEPTNSEFIDLRVDNVLSAPMDISSPPREDIIEEEDDEM
ncbi:hypothetical protein HPB49_004576 [Dermacentor silvarum]|uniref:Uncharacterized protein n=2 Tax=Dermacentor silvarum TaxID=543639 RepID=A0ACB8CJH1_DERSI|nr:hypothetical protein HPB49_004576 [Dermacentor silvarum]